MLAEDRVLARSDRWGELLAVIERHGDWAMDFVWRHKRALTVSTILATLLAEPEVFLGGGRELMSKAVQELTRLTRDCESTDTRPPLKRLLLSCRS